MNTVQDFIDAGIIAQSEVDKEYIGQKDIDYYNEMSDKELREALDNGIKFMKEWHHTSHFHQMRRLHNQVIKQIMEERIEDVETTLDDMTNIVNLQEHEGDEEYFKEIDEMYARIATLKAEG